MSGWIKLPREIQDHWIWSDSRRLKMWIKLLFMAKWTNDRVNVGNSFIELRRGQILTTLRTLKNQLDCSRGTVSDFLKVLEEGGMIEKEVTPKYTIITILDYDNFQPAKQKGKGNSEESEYGQTDQGLDQRLDRKVGQLIKNKEENNKEERIISSSSSSSREEFLKIFEEIRNDGEFRNNLRTLLSQSENEIGEGMEKFLSERKLKENFTGDRGEIRSHLTNWLRKHFEVKPRRQKNSNNQNNNQNVKTEIDRRRGVTPSPEHNPGVRTTKF